MRLLYFGTYCLPFAILIIIFTLSSQDATTSATLSQSVTNVVNTFMTDALTTESASIWHLAHGQMRALAHIGLFCIFSMSCMLAFNLCPKTRARQIPYTFFLSLICAITDEVIQLGSPGRTCEFIDIAKDMFGACIGIACVWVLLRLWHWLIAKKA